MCCDLRDQEIVFHEAIIEKESSSLIGTRFMFPWCTGVVMECRFGCGLDGCRCGGDTFDGDVIVIAVRN